MGELPARIGDYEIEAQIGEGGMAIVYRGRHPILDTHHAIKVLDPAYRTNPVARQRFLDEARIQAKHLDHPNIVKVTNVIATDEHAALVMELVDGTSLDHQLTALKDHPDAIKRLMLDILDAIGHAHAAGIIHRDLKPANILLARKGDAWIPKVTDFGIAKVTVADKLHKKSTAVDARMGTLHYMSPEQVRRSKDVTVRSDVWSLGALLYELATGHAPFEGDSEFDLMESIVRGRYEPPERRVAGLDPDIARVIAKALAVDPADRYASCAEMAAELGGSAASAAPRAAAAPARTEPATATRTAPSSAPAPRARRRTWRWLALGGALVIAAVATVLALSSTRRPRQRELTNADHVLEAAIAASGGRERLSERWGLRLTHSAMVGEPPQESTPLRMTEIMTESGYKVVTLLLDVTYWTVATEDEAWQGINVSGERTQLTGRLRAKLLRENRLNALLRWRELYARIELAGTVPFGIGRAYKVVGTTSDGDSFTRYVDTGTHREVGQAWTESHEARDVAIQIEVKSWQDVRGVPYPRTYVRREVHGTESHEVLVTVDSVEENPDLPDDAFTPGPLGLRREIE